MKRYRLWALGVPDLHPEGFQPRLGGMRLFEGWGGGDDGPGGSDTRDENTSDYSPSGSGEGGGDPFSGFADYADSPNVGPAYGSPSTEGDYGFAVFNAIDKVEAGQPLTRGELQTLTDAGLGGMTAPSGRTVSEELSASSGPSLTGQQIHDILYGPFPNFSNINFGNIGSLFGPPAPVDESGPGGVGVSEERTGDYGVPLASEGAPPTERTTGSSFWSRFGRVSAPAPVTVEEVEELPEDEEAEFQSVLSPPYGQLSPKAQDAYVNALAKGLSDDEAYIEALRTEDQELAFENKIQELAAKEFVPTPTDDSGAGGVDRPTSSEVLGVYQDYMDEFGGSADLGALPSAATNALDLAAAQAAEELAAPVAGDPTRAALYGDAGYGEGLTGAQTQAFDDTLAATGDVGQALGAMEAVTAPAPSFGFTSFGGFGRRGGSSRFGRSRSAAPPPAPAPAPAPAPPPAPAPAAKELAVPVGIDDSGAGGVNFDAFVNDGTTEGIDAPASASSSADASTRYSYSGGEGGEGTTDTTAPAGTEPSTLADVIAALRSGNLSDALNTLREVTAPAPPPEPAGPPIPSNVVGTGAGGILVDNEGNPVLSTSYGLPGEYVSSGPTLDPALLELAATARKMTVEELRAVIDAEIQGGSPVGTTGLSRETLEALQEKGFGGRDIGLEPGTQTVDQALASMQANQFLTDYLPTIIGMVGPPGTGALLSGVRTISDLMQGKLSPGAAMTRELIGLLARQANIPASVLTNILEGKFGDAAANQAKSFMFNTLAQEAGVEGSAIGMIADELGFLNPLTGQIDKAVTEVIPDQNFGIPGRVAAGLDEFVEPIQGAVSQGLGALGDAAQTGLTGLGNVLGQIGQGVQTGVGAITGGIGDLIDAVTGRGAEEQARQDEIAYQEQVQQDLADAQARQDEIAYQEQVQQQLAEEQAREQARLDEIAYQEQVQQQLAEEQAREQARLDEIAYQEQVQQQLAEEQAREQARLDAVDDSGVGGVDDPSQFEFRENRDYAPGTTGYDEYEESLGFTPVVDETGPGGADVTEERTEDYFGAGSTGVIGEELGEGVPSGVDEWDQSLIRADTDGIYDSSMTTGSVGLPGEELGEGILTGVDPWDQALIDADTGGVYDLDTGTGADTVTNVGGVGTDTGGGDTDTVVQPPPPVIPPTGGGTTLPYGSYFARVPTGYQVVQGLYGPIMQYTYGNLPLGGT
jgi:hypothetical protein